MSALDEVMRARSDEELERVVTADAPDYTDEALDAARAELVRRGRDVSGLVARRGEPRGVPAESQERVKRLALQSFAAFLVLGAASFAIPPLAVLSSAAFWISVLLALWSISR